MKIYLFSWDNEMVTAWERHFHNEQDVNSIVIPAFGKGCGELNPEIIALMQKRAYDMLKDLTHNEWWTDTTIVTDENGFAETDSFKGDYTVTVDGIETKIVADKASETVIRV